MDEDQNIQYVNSDKYPPPVGEISPLQKDAYQSTTADESYKLNYSFQPTKLKSSYELNQSYQPALPNSYKLPESYPPTTLESPHALKESYETATSKNPYKLIKEYYETSAPEYEDDTQEDSDSEYSYKYDSFKRKVPSKEESIPYTQSAASPPHKHQIATGREKNPYTYFYVGRKLWYIPLFFSVYFMLYVLALVVRSISRHKIVFPATKGKYEKRELNSGLGDITHQVTTALETTERLYL
jgi:hypothetical protein